MGVEEESLLLKKLISKRGYTKGAITRQFNFVSDQSEFSSALPASLKARKDNIIESFKKYEEYNIQIRSLCPDDTEDAGQIEDKFFYVIGKIDERTSMTLPQREEIPMEPKSSKCKLPTINISPFTEAQTARAYQLERNIVEKPTVASFLDFLDKRALALENAELAPQRPARLAVHAAAVEGPKSSGCHYSPSGLDDDDDVTNSTFLPRTEKLIGSTTTTSTTSTTTTPSTTTRRTTRVTVTLPSPTTPVRTTLKTTISTTTKSKTVPTTVKMGTTPTNTPNTTTKLTTTPTTAVTTKATTKVVPKTTRWTNPDVEKARKEQQIESNNVVKEKENHEGSSGSTAALVCSLLVVLCCAGGALLALRSARGRAALARLRARTTHDTEVQYLTRDCD